MGLPWGSRQCPKPASALAESVPPGLLRLHLFLKNAFQSVAVEAAARTRCTASQLTVSSAACAASFFGMIPTVRHRP
jgi:hypothetical protein